MEEKRYGGAFSGFHPLVNFLYFALVITGSMFFMHPVCLAISLICSFLYSWKLTGRRAVRFNLIYLLPMMLMAALLNPMFNHEGQTILAYLHTGNPLTLESIAYGVAAAVMLGAAVGWFSCFNAVMTSDKFIYLFGRVIPALSLILAMVLRFVPKFKAQIKVISNAQRCIGRDVSNGSLMQRAKHGLTILSIMVTWALENSIETADSMKSRGYGLPGRTAFSVFRFDGRDKAALAVIGGLGLYVFGGVMMGTMYWRYFPTMKGVSPGFFSATTFAAYGGLCLTPVIIEFWEDRKWKLLQSNI